MLFDIVALYVIDLQWVLLALPRGISDRILEILFPVLRRL
jgi:hypothetical protein